MILDDAKTIVTADRREQYGPIRPNMDLIAKLWAEYIDSRIVSRRSSMSGTDVAVMMILMKVARHAIGSGSRDTWVDIAWYAQMAAVCAGDDEEESGPPISG